MLDGQRIRKALHENKNIALQLAKKIENNLLEKKKISNADLNVETNENNIKIVENGVQQENSILKCNNLHYLINHFFEDKFDVEKFTKNSIKRFKCTRNALLKNADDTNIQSVDDSFIKEYLKKRKNQNISNSSLNKELAALKNVLKNAVKKKLIKENLSEDVKYYPKISGPILYFKRDEIDMILKHNAPREYTLYSTYFYTGLRKMEAARLKLEDIDFENGQIKLENDLKNNNHTKNKDNGYVPINSELKIILLNWINNERKKFCNCDTNLLFPTIKGKIDTHIRSKFKNLLAKLKLNYSYNIHTRRHTFCSYLAMAGVDLLKIMKLARHRDYQTTLRYAHLSPNYLKSEIEMLNFK